MNANHHRFEHIELWFEHDLLDQLQLIQILDFFTDEGVASGKLHLFQADDYLGVQPPDKIMQFRNRRALVTQEQLATAKLAWAAFVQPSPRVWANLLKQDLSALPWLRLSVARMLQELPSAQTGRTRTETEFLSVIAEEWETAVRCVGQYLGTLYFERKPAFVGDWTLFNLGV